MFMSIKNY